MIAAQDILAGGVVTFLILVTVPGVVWSLRCARQSPNYRFPALGVLPPIFVGGLYLAQHLL